MLYCLLEPYEGRLGLAVVFTLGFLVVAGGVGQTGTLVLGLTIAEGRLAVTDLAVVFGLAVVVFCVVVVGGFVGGGARLHGPSPLDLFLVDLLYPFSHLLHFIPM